MRSCRIPLAAVLALALAATSAVVAAADALGLPPFTTAAQSTRAVGSGQAELFSLNAACHPSFDRIVIRTRFATPAFSAGYVREVDQPSGRPLPLPGSARLRFVVRSARAHSTGGTALLPGSVTPGCPSIVQVRRAEDFEGVVVCSASASAG